MVLVRYLSYNGTWQPWFIVNQRLPHQQKISISNCPSCGAPLNIHALR